MRADELDTMLERATDGGDHEWGWYVDDVPRLVGRVRELEDELAAATDECHTLYARVHGARAGRGARVGAHLVRALPRTHDRARHLDAGVTGSGSSKGSASWTCLNTLWTSRTLDTTGVAQTRFQLPLIGHPPNGGGSDPTDRPLEAPRSRLSPRTAWGSSFAFAALPAPFPAER